MSGMQQQGSFSCSYVTGTLGQFRAVDPSARRSSFTMDSRGSNFPSPAMTHGKAVLTTGVSRWLVVGFSSAVSGKKGGRSQSDPFSP